MAATLRQLAIIELLVTLAVIGFVTVASTRLVGLALRPLGGIEDTASRIAAGDLGQRIAQVDTRTEVGRLGILPERELQNCHSRKSKLFPQSFDFRRDDTQVFRQDR